jgi:hypothetical protein
MKTLQCPFWYQTAISSKFYSMQNTWRSAKFRIFLRCVTECVVLCGCECAVSRWFIACYPPHSYVPWVLFLGPQMDSGSAPSHWGKHCALSFCLLHVSNRCHLALFTVAILIS